MLEGNTQTVTQAQHAPAAGLKPARGRIFGCILVALWLTFGSLWLPFGSIWLAFVSLLVLLGSLLLTLVLNFHILGSPGFIFPEPL